MRIDKMNLNNFENHIDKKIFARGYDYYENDYVTSVEKIDDNEYEAEVEGTELYTVEVELDDKSNIIDTQCDCPYDMGEYCKHQVAVFLALRDMKNNIPSSNNHIPDLLEKCSELVDTSNLRILRFRSISLGIWGSRRKVEFWA
jgi:uncharacterized Zn finger protein